MVTLQPTPEQVTEYTETGEVTLTTEQVARVVALTRHEHSRVEAERDYAGALAALWPYGPTLEHTGGNVWLVQVQLAQFDLEIEGEIHHPFVWVSKEGDDSFQVCAYLHHFDEGVTVLAPQWVNFAGLALAAQKALDCLGTYITDHPELTGGIKAWFEVNTSDVVHGHIDEIPYGWVTRVRVKAEIEYQTDSGYSQYWPAIVEFDHPDDMPIYALRWHDGVTGEWVEWFDTYDEALARFAWLFLVVVKERTFDELDIEVRRPEPASVLPTITEHFETVHPGAQPEVWVWWDVPYRHYGTVESTDDGPILQIQGDGRSGDGEGPNTYYCVLCDETLDGDLEEDYV